ncbi:MAG: hypothetical protein QOC81_837 [Thermoanaerobaculia bacterium]|jgi:Zn-dependent peptidase ImmA (M78 family)|nr:hypothetical protein [Thermoanaerobaculia bacterium]
MTRPSDAELYAQEFVARYGTDASRRLFDIAARLSLSVKEVDAKSSDGALLRVKGADRGRVLLNRNVPEAGRRLFTLAHEIGHFVMPGHGRESSLCRATDVETWDESVRATEREANEFAASVLMPEAVCRPFVREEPSMRVVGAMREACGISLTATLVRYVRMSSFAVAMVRVEHGNVKWPIRSPEFGAAIKRGHVHGDSFAADAVAGRTVPGELESVPAIAWLYEEAVIDGSRILEASVAMPRYNAVVTLLYMHDRILRARDEPEDDDLDPVEFTLDRKHWPKKR